MGACHASTSSHSRVTLPALRQNALVLLRGGRAGKGVSPFP